jgi:hypothetical protein
MENAKSINFFMMFDLALTRASRIRSKEIEEQNVTITCDAFSLTPELLEKNCQRPRE